jgi:hypothetical protein
LRVGFLDGFEAGEGAVVVEVVEVVVGLADLGSEIDRIGVGGRIVGVREGGGSEEEGEKETKDFDAAYYGSSPKRGALFVMQDTYLLMQIQMIRLVSVDRVLDAGHGRLYPLIPGLPGLLYSHSD